MLKVLTKAMINLIPLKLKKVRNNLKLKSKVGKQYLHVPRQKTKPNSIKEDKISNDKGNQMKDTDPDKLWLKIYNISLQTNNTTKR